MNLLFEMLTLIWWLNYDIGIPRIANFNHMYVTITIMITRER